MLNHLGFSILLVTLFSVVGLAGDSAPNRSLTGPLSPKEESASFHLPAGFRAELVAAEPNVVDPVAIAFDENGRNNGLWSCVDGAYGFTRTSPAAWSRFRAAASSVRCRMTISTGLPIPITSIFGRLFSPITICAATLHCL